MERVATLIERLQGQLSAKAAVDDMLLTVEMLHSELNHLKSAADSSSSAVITFHIPIATPTTDTEIADEPKETLMLDVSEAEIEAELEQIKRTAEAKNSISLKNRRPFFFDPVEDTPTLSNQKKTPAGEINQQIGSQASDTLNDKLRESKTELREALKDTPIKDLKKAIGVNDRFLFINELFKGDEVMYERSIKTINGFSIFPEAEYWIRRELKTKLGWNDQDVVVKQFDQLVKRRFPTT